MQNVSPEAGNEGTDRDVAAGKIGNHVTITGIVNVEQKISSSGDLSGIGGNAKTGTGQPGYPLANGGAAA